HLVATGFLRTAIDNTFAMELNRPLERYQVLHDTIDSLTSNLLGLTVHCAQCHDHKFDPIPQVEYYRLLACLKPSFDTEHWIQGHERHLADVAPKELEAINRHNVGIDAKLAALNRQITDVRGLVEKRLTERKMAAIPEALRADLRAALAARPGRRT